MPSQGWGKFRESYTTKSVYICIFRNISFITKHGTIPYIIMERYCTNQLRATIFVCRNHIISCIVESNADQYTHRNSNKSNRILNMVSKTAIQTLSLGSFIQYQHPNIFRARKGHAYIHLLHWYLLVERLLEHLLCARRRSSLQNPATMTPDSEKQDSPFNGLWSTDRRQYFVIFQYILFAASVNLVPSPFKF